ncbi:MAG: TIR domain-containing protein, partial [Lachnospiraceae bacterium]|nr:TIR domain-containing protein [Lachnospiraceae bacterium]
MYDVFISYRRSDGSGIAESIAEYLQSKGLRVFFDKNEI